MRNAAAAAFFVMASALAQPSAILNIGVGHVPPVTYIDSHGAPGGFAVDVLNEAARREGIRLHWVRAGNSLEIQQALDRGDLDLVPAGMVTPERQQKYFVSEPWWFTELTVVARQDSSIRTSADLRGRRLGLASPGYALLAAKAYPQATLLAFNDAATVTSAACRNDIDAALITHGYLDDLSLQRPDACNGIRLSTFVSDSGIELAVIARRNHKAIAQRLRTRINDMALDGTLASMAARHPSILTSGALTLAETLRERYQLRLWVGSFVAAFSLLLLSVWFLLKQRSTQQRLRHERELMRGVVDHIPVMIAIREPDSSKWMVNGEFERLLGPPSATLPCLSRDPDEGRAAWHDCSIASKTGESIPSSWANVLLSHGTRVAIGLDLRERLRSEKAFRDGEERLRLAMEATKLGAFDFDPRTRKMVWSGTALEQFGIKADGAVEIGYDTFLSGIHPEDRDRVDRDIAAALAEGEHYASEYRTVGLQDGRERWISSWGRVFRDEQHAAVRFMGVRLDVSERRRAEDAIRRQAELINLSHDAIITAGNDRVISSWNAGATEMYGWTEEEVLGRVVHQLLRTEASISTASIDEILRREGRWDGLLVHTRSDGRKLTVESRHVLTRNAAGQPAGILEINRDITERVSAEQQLREVNAELEQRVAARTQELAAANRELEAFAYSVSHDLRAPLRGIEGWSVALLEDCAGGLDERGRVYLDRVRSETLRMGRLIEEMLRLSRVARLDMEFEPVDLSALAQDIAGRLRESCPERNVTFHIAPAVVAAGDRHLLEIALTNLFENAVKFTANRPHPEVEFGQVTRDGNPAVFVRDNGVGFDMAYAHRLFGPFQRLHKDSEFPGIGVGLATVQRVIHRHGGRIWAESAMGSGATFYFVLGTALASAAAPGGPAHVAAHGPHAAIDNGSGHVQYGGIRKI